MSTPVHYRFDYLVLGSGLAGLYAADEDARAWRVASTVTNLMLVGLALLAGGFAIAAPWLVPAFTPGFDAAGIARTVELSRLMLLSPIVDPGRATYPDPGDEGLGIVAGYELRAVSALIAPAMSSAGRRRTVTRPPSSASSPDSTYRSVGKFTASVMISRRPDACSAAASFSSVLATARVAFS